MPWPFNTFQFAISSANRSNADDTPSNNRNDGQQNVVGVSSKTTAFAKMNRRSLLEMGGVTTESALHLQQMQQQQQQQKLQRSLQKIVPTDNDVVFRRGKRTLGKVYYDDLIEKYNEIFFRATRPEQKNAIVETVVNTLLHSLDEDLEEGEMTTTNAPIRRRILRQKDAKQYVEVNGKELMTRIKRSFRMQNAKTSSATTGKPKPPEQSQEPNPPDQQQFVPLFQPSTRGKKPRDGMTSKLKQLLDHQQEQQVLRQQFGVFPHTLQQNHEQLQSHQQQDQYQQQQQQQQHDPNHHPQQRLWMTSSNQTSNYFLKQHEQRESEVIGAEMRRLRLQQLQQRIIPQQQGFAPNEEPRPLPTPSQVFDALLKSSELNATRSLPQQALNSLRPEPAPQQKQRAATTTTSSNRGMVVVNNYDGKPRARSNSKAPKPSKPRKTATTTATASTILPVIENTSFDTTAIVAAGHTARSTTDEDDDAKPHAKSKLKSKVPRQQRKRKQPDTMTKTEAVSTHMNSNADSETTRSTRINGDDTDAKKHHTIASTTDASDEKNSTTSTKTIISATLDNNGDDDKFEDRSESKKHSSKNSQRKPPPAEASGKIFPARRKKLAAKKKVPKRKLKTPAAKRIENPPSASAPKDSSSITPNAFSASGITTANSDLGKAASVLMNMTLAQPTAPPIYRIGTRTKKYFAEFGGWFQGTIRSYNSATKFYSIEYEDNDMEDLELHEIDTGSLPTNKYDVGMQYEILLVSKNNGKRIGWFVGTIQSKYFHQARTGRGYRSNGVWRYNVVYSDGDSEDVDEDYITESIRIARQRGRKMVGQTGETADRKESDADREASESSCEKSVSDSSSDDNSTTSSEEESSSEEEIEPNPNNIPHWTGKQHQQFLVGLKKYGLGNLEDIHEAQCIPGRSFRELLRYWEWYVSDLEEKGFVPNYGAKGTVNGKTGTRSYEEEEEKKEESSDEGFRKGLWTAEEQEMVVKAYIFEGKSYKTMSDYMKTRSPSQINSYFNKNKKKIVKESEKYADEAERRNTNSCDNSANDSNDSDIVSPFGKRLWTPGEHELVAEGLAMYGKNYSEVSAYMKSRTRSQIAGYVKRHQKSIANAMDAKKRLYRKISRKTGAWSCCEESKLVEAHAIFDMDFERIADLVKTRDAGQIKSRLEANASKYKDESDFDLGDQFAFPIELFHVLNVAPFEGFDHIISWNDNGGSVLIHDNDLFAKLVFPMYSHEGTSVEKFYNNLERFEFKEVKKKGHGAKNNTGAFVHPSFQRGDYKKIEQHCRKSFDEWMKMNESSDTE